MGGNLWLIELISVAYGEREGELGCACKLMSYINLYFPKVIELCQYTCF